MLASLRRITSTSEFIPEIDGFRFFAIFAVYLYHLAGDILRHSPLGFKESLAGNGVFEVTQVLSVGVPLFFVISGFVLGKPFATAHLLHKPQPSLKRYFLRRLTRLEPPYLLCLLLFFALKVAAARGTAGGLIPNLIASVFYLHNFAFGGPSVINYVAWSLEIEVQFYILVPALAWIFGIRRAWLRRAVLVGLIIAATGASSAVGAILPLRLSLLGYSQYFLCGFLLVEWYLTAHSRRQHRTWDLGFLAGWCAMLAMLIHGGGSAIWVMPWLILFLYIAAFYGVIARRIVTNRWLVTIGGMCYSIYLLHNYLIAALGMITERLLVDASFSARLLTQFSLMTPIILSLAVLYFYLVERPCMRPDWPARLKKIRFAARVPSHLS